MHIKEAIQINKLRKVKYSALSNGKTKSLSSVLITSEKLTLPIAKYYDRKGEMYNDNGIMVVKEDFVDMNLPDFDRPVNKRATWTSKINDNLNVLIRDFMSKTKIDLKSDKDLSIIYDEGLKYYKSVKEIEENNQVNCIMTKHVLESICLISKNGISYALQSNNNTVGISKGLIFWHKIALKNSVWLDRWGNKFHQKNIGILVNDMPEIIIE